MSTPNSLNGWARWNSTFKRLLGPSAALCAVILFFSLVAPESFCTVQNARTLSAQSVVVVLGAIGMTFVVVGGGIDLSIGSVIALSSVVSALMVRAGFSSGTAALLGCLCWSVSHHVGLVPAKSLFPSPLHGYASQIFHHCY